MKVIGFILRQVSNPSKIPYSLIFKNALAQQVYIIDEDSEKLRKVHAGTIEQLEQPEWKDKKYDILDNMCYFFDARRSE